MKRLFVTVLGLAWGLLVPSLIAQGPFPGGFGPGFERWGRHGMGGSRLIAALENDQVKTALGLSDQQTTRLRQLVVETEKSTVKTRAEMAVHAIELRELMRADKPDHDAVLKMVQEMSELRGELMKQHIEALLAAKSVLTPEQQKKIRTFIEGRRGGFWMGREREGMGRPRGERGPGGPPEPPHAAPPRQHE